MDTTTNLPAPRPRGASMAIIPQNWQEITAIAGAICRANMAPKSYLDKQGNPQPEMVAIAIMHGLEVGFTPMASLQSIAVINGMPSIYGDGLLALIRSSGLLEDVEETMEWDDRGPVAATCKMWRRGEKTPTIQTYAREDAIKARLWGKAGPWSDHPHRMLQWRARGWCGRDKFADVLRGLHSAEEVEDMVDITSRGSATVAPIEPKRSDFETKDPNSTPVEVVSPPASEEGRQAATTSPAAGGSPNVPTTEAAAPSDPEPFDPDKPGPGDTLTFDRFTNASAFIDFGQIFLEKTNAEGAKQFLAFYEKTLIAVEKMSAVTKESVAFMRAIAAEKINPPDSMPLDTPSPDIIPE